MPSVNPAIPPPTMRIAWPPASAPPIVSSLALLFRDRVHAHASSAIFVATINERRSAAKSKSPIPTIAAAHRITKLRKRVWKRRRLNGGRKAALIHTPLWHQCLSESELLGLVEGGLSTSFARSRRSRGAAPKNFSTIRKTQTLSVPIELEGYYYSRLRQSDDFREGVEPPTPSAKRSFRGS